jgi:hypothetical protein
MLKYTSNIWRLKYIFSDYFLIINLQYGWVPVAHACNPSYSAGRDQENHGSKPTQANSSRDLISKQAIIERAGGGIGPEFKPQHQAKKKKNLQDGYFHHHLQLKK